MDSDIILKLYNTAQKHLQEHGCSAYPYKFGERLAELARKAEPKNILEIGTGMGYSSALMALASPSSHVQTIEKDEAHVETARQFFDQLGIDGRISIVQGVAEEILPGLAEQFECIFFDGYGIHYEFLPHYQRLLKRDGLLIVANNHLQTKTSDRFFAELEDPRQWKILETFDDTTVAQKR